MKTSRLLIAALAVLIAAHDTQAQQKPGTGVEWAAVQSLDRATRETQATPMIPRLEGTEETVRSTLVGAALGAVATLAYFQIRDEDTYECNECVEWGIVTSSFTMLGTGLGAKKAGASTQRSFWASLAGTVVGGAVALALIEPLDAGWTAGAIGFTVSQGVTAGLIAGS